MNVFKLLGALGAAALAAGGLIVAGRTGLGKSDDPVENDKAPEAEGGEPVETTEAEVVQTESDDGSADA